jgi:thiamine transport system substrate-binding protein
VENPSTSSPGLAFLLATIAAFGENGWEDFWQALRDGDVAISSGWEDAYYGQFSGGAGEGDRPLVVSYASSPPAEVLFGEDPESLEAPTGVILGSCYRQVEFAGTLAGTEHPAEAAAFVDFLLSDAVQEDIPLQMFVFPVRDVTLPEVFVRHAKIATDPFELDPSLVAANREDWIATWVDLMLR